MHMYTEQVGRLCWGWAPDTPKLVQGWDLQSVMPNHAYPVCMHVCAINTTPLTSIYTKHTQTCACVCICTRTCTCTRMRAHTHGQHMHKYKHMQAYTRLYNPAAAAADKTAGANSLVLVLWSYGSLRLALAANSPLSINRQPHAGQAPDPQLHVAESYTCCCGSVAGHPRWPTKGLSSQPRSGQVRFFVGSWGLARVRACVRVHACVRDLCEQSVLRACAL